MRVAYRPAGAIIFTSSPPAIVMDEQVIAAMARWPDVPAVFGWLSLTESGQWRLHPQGDALQDLASAGEAITSPQILAFMNRNYDADAFGQWYFQNGPQRVYVRLDGAPYLAYTTVDANSGRMKLSTHTGLDIREVHALHVTANGRLYAHTDRGAALIAGRDLPALLDVLQPENAAGQHESHVDMHTGLEHCLEHHATIDVLAHDLLGFPDTAIPLHFCPDDELEARLGFHRIPQAERHDGQATETPSDGAGH